MADSFLPSLQTIITRTPTLNLSLRHTLLEIPDAVYDSQADPPSSGVGIATSNYRNAACSLGSGPVKHADCACALSNADRVSRLLTTNKNLSSGNICRNIQASVCFTIQVSLFWALAVC
jgi:hypothetical protein